MPGFQFADRLDRRKTIAATLLLTGTEGERQAVDEDVALVHAPGLRQGLDEPFGDGYLVLGGSRLAALVDRQSDNRSPVLTHNRHDAREPARRPLAVLEVDGVDDRTTTETLKARLDDLRLGGVEHQGQC